MVELVRGSRAGVNGCRSRQAGVRRDSHSRELQRYDRVFRPAASTHSCARHALAGQVWRCRYWRTAPTSLATGDVP